mgnify:CR=1 FL=1
MRKMLQRLAILDGRDVARDDWQQALSKTHHHRPGRGQGTQPGPV